MPLAGVAPGSNGHIETRIALTQEMLAEAYLADGKVHEAKEVILEALEVLDYAPPIGKEARGRGSVTSTSGWIAQL